MRLVLPTGQNGVNVLTPVDRGHTRDLEDVRSRILAIRFVKEILIKLDTVTLFTAQVCIRGCLYDLTQPEWYTRSKWGDLDV